MSKIDDVLGALDRRIGVNGDGEENYCDCETLVHGLRIPIPPGHSCEYVRARNELIGEASRIANTLAGDDPYAWTRRFVAEMDRLSKHLLGCA